MEILWTERRILVVDEFPDTIERELTLSLLVKFEARVKRLAVVLQCLGLVEVGNEARMDRLPVNLVDQWVLPWLMVLCIEDAEPRENDEA